MAFIKIGGLSFDSFEELFEYKRTHPTILALLMEDRTKAVTVPIGLSTRQSTIQVSPVVVPSSSMAVWK